MAVELGDKIAQIGTGIYRLVMGKDVDITTSTELTDIDDADIMLVDEDATGTQASTKKATFSTVWSWIVGNLTGLVDTASIETSVPSAATNGQLLSYDTTNGLTWVDSPQTSIADGSITEPKLDISNSPGNGKYLYWLNGMQWQSIEPLNMATLDLTFLDDRVHDLDGNSLTLENTYDFNVEATSSTTFASPSTNIKSASTGSSGSLHIWKSNNYTAIQTGSTLASNNTVTLPVSSGTLALTSDIDVTSITTNGTSGVATLTNGVLNIPNYSGSSGGGGSTFTDNYQANLDGVNDYIKIDTSGGTSPINKTKGTVSMWVDWDHQPSFHTELFVMHNYPVTSSGADYIILQAYKVSNSPNVWALRFSYKSTDTNGNVVDGHSFAKTGSSFHGTGASRNKNNFGAMGSSYLANLDYDTYFTTGGKHHIAASWDTTQTWSYGGNNYNGTLKLYINGALANIGQSSFPANNGTGSLKSLAAITGDLNYTYIGIRMQAADHTYSDWFDGGINDFALFDEAIGDTNVAAIYNSGVESDLTTNANSYTKSSALVGYWKFEEGSGTTVADGSTNNNDATLVDGASFQAFP